MTTPDFAKMVPGFDFLQSLMKGAGAGMPSMSQWIAPTLDAEEVNKRIQELRTVQFWLEQNAKMLGATIQALEVQRMTLATLKTMNLPMSELRESMKLDPNDYISRMAATPAAPRPAAAAPAPAMDDDNDSDNDDSGDEDETAAATGASAEPEAGGKPRSSRAESGGATIDPVQWWGALTRQFTELASNAMKDNPVEAATQMAGAAFKQAVQPMAEAAQAVARAGSVSTARTSKTAKSPEPAKAPAAARKKTPTAAPKSAASSTSRPRTKASAKTSSAAARQTRRAAPAKGGR
jgi:hypothetical protein